MSKKYVALNELAELTQDRGTLRDHAMSFLIAGRDTTSGMLSWTVNNLQTLRFNISNLPRLSCTYLLATLQYTPNCARRSLMYWGKVTVGAQRV